MFRLNYVIFILYFLDGNERLLISGTYKCLPLLFAQ